VYRVVNCSFCNFLGKSEEEIIGKTDFDLFPGKEAKIYRSDDIRVMNSGQPQVQEELTTGSPEKKWLQVSKTPVYDENSNCMGVLCTVTDITKQKLTEAQLKKAHDKLELRVAERTHKLAQTNERLKGEITERKKAEDALKKANDELELRIDQRTAQLVQRTYRLEESNIALKVLTAQRQTDKEDLELKVLFNIRKRIVPHLEKLAKGPLNDTQKTYLQIITTELNEIIEPFAPGLTNTLSLLTPAEIQIADLTKQGKSTKEIANLLTLSPATIATHKQRIRKKLGLTNKKLNLRTILSTK